MKSVRVGAALWTSFSPHSAMPWAWATSGVSRTYVTATVEVSTTTFDISVTLGALQRKNSKNPKLLWKWVGRWVQVSLGIFFWKIVPT